MFYGLKAIMPTSGHDEPTYCQSHNDIDLVARGRLNSIPLVAYTRRAMARWGYRDSWNPLGWNLPFCWNSISLDSTLLGSHLL